MHTMSRPRTSRLSLTSLHDAARKGDSRSLQRLIAIIDPTAAEKVADVLHTAGEKVVHAKLFNGVEVETMLALHRQIGDSATQHSHVTKLAAVGCICNSLYL